MPRGVKRKDPAARPAIARGIPEKVVDTFLDNWSIDEEMLTFDAKLVDDLGADSLDIIELSMALEEEYGVAIGDDITERWETGTVKDVLDSLRQLGAKV